METSEELAHLTAARNVAYAQMHAARSKRDAAKRVVADLRKELGALQEELKTAQQRLSASSEKLPQLRARHYTAAMIEFERISHQKYARNRQQKELRAARRDHDRRKVRQCRRGVRYFDHQLYWHSGSGFTHFNRVAHVKQQHDSLQYTVLHISEKIATYEATLQQARRTAQELDSSFRAAKHTYALAEYALQFAQGINPLWHHSYSHEELIALAEIDHNYRGNVTIQADPTGVVNLYYGGVNNPLGIGHGHNALDHRGVLIYRRPPFAPRGVQNFTAEYFTSKHQIPVAT